MVRDSDKEEMAKDKFINHTYDNYVKSEVAHQYPVPNNLHEKLDLPLSQIINSNTTNNNEDLMRKVYGSGSQHFNLTSSGHKFDLSWYEYGKEHFELISDSVSKNVLYTTAQNRVRSVESTFNRKADANDEYSSLQQRINGSVVCSNSTNVKTGIVNTLVSESQLKRHKNNKTKSTNKPSLKPAKILTSKERKKKKILSIDSKQDINYEQYLPLHVLWKQYIVDLIDGSYETLNGTELLVKADFHGCIMKVVKSKCATLVGAEGIIIQETENTFKILTNKNVLKTISKQGCQFEFDLPMSGGADVMDVDITASHKKVTIYGDNFRYRSADRASKKFKRRDVIDL
ncbi:ribonuclease P protein subunit p29 [Acrasis kona]|uniref:Ribonuclease P protein subunit p29 n=1 Tax=Acrasis kona TaxID=1008807 RepID=A0AAW2ZGH5_9EUKA